MKRDRKKATGKKAKTVKKPVSRPAFAEKKSTVAADAESGTYSPAVALTAPATRAGTSCVRSWPSLQDHTTKL